MRRSFKKGKKLFTSRFSGEQSASVEGKLIKMLSTDDDTLKSFSIMQMAFW